MTELILRLPPEVSPEEAAMLLAAKLYERGTLSLGQAAELAGYSKRAFMELLGKYSVAVFDYPRKYSVAVFDYPPEELAQEIGD